MDAISHSNMRNQLDRFKEQQISKYEKFQRRQSPQRASIDHERLVVNLSDRVLAEDEISVLSKRGNFAITPRHIPVEDSSVRRQPLDIYRTRPPRRYEWN
ncbi:unnamed protein product [Acanthoscelides obtectus]|uniref:Uncharacterized protein n=1 Tax=Acanthoscelides obtectus TaxID=200917 RepID=A0A9P0MC56_ACAOB|nr:unnamed protein product [Acanthoscelides obtectus]CAK1679483.1 hypothetical protein AOBTE_LOCUS32282 [Acanthoscelides obtectus]